MAEFVKKTIIGYREVAGGQADEEYSHVVLTRTEYESLISEKNKLQEEIIKAKKNEEISIEMVKEAAKSEIRNIQELTYEEIKQSNQKIEAAQKEIEYLRGLNSNLLRISRERANAERKLKPKKQHTGYVVVYSGEKEHRYKASNGFVETAMFWETVLQSPYSIEFTQEQVKNQIQELKQTKEDGVSLLGKIGIDAISKSTIEKAKIDTKNRNLNIIIESRLKANYRSGYWEVILLHTKALGIVPEDMRITKQ